MGEVKGKVKGKRKAPTEEVRLMHPCLPSQPKEKHNECPGEGMWGFPENRIHSVCPCSCHGKIPQKADEA